MKSSDGVLTYSTIPTSGERPFVPRISMESAWAQQFAPDGIWGAVPSVGSVNLPVPAIWRDVLSGHYSKLEQTMADEITRAELDAKLEAVEARLDSKVSRIEVVAEHIASSISEIKTDMKAVHAEIREIDRHRWSTLFILFFGVFALVAGIMSFIKYVLPLH